MLNIWDVTTATPGPELGAARERRRRGGTAAPAGPRIGALDQAAPRTGVLGQVGLRTELPATSALGGSAGREAGSARRLGREGGAPIVAGRWRSHGVLGPHRGPHRRPKAAAIGDEGDVPVCERKKGRGGGARERRKGRGRSVASAVGEERLVVMDLFTVRNANWRMRLVFGLGLLETV